MNTLLCLSGKRSAVTNSVSVRLRLPVSVSVCSVFPVSILPHLQSTLLLGRRLSFVTAWQQMVCRLGAGTIPSPKFSRIVSLGARTWSRSTRRQHCGKRLVAQYVLTLVFFYGEFQASRRAFHFHGAGLSRCKTVTYLYFLCVKRNKVLRTEGNISGIYSRPRRSLLHHKSQ